MTAILTKVEQFFDSDDIDGAREEVAKTVVNLRAVDVTVLDYAALLALGSQKALEIGLSSLSRTIFKNETQINSDVVWLFLAAVLSRRSITPDSPSRLTILGLINYVEDWELPIFSLMTPALDYFFKVSLSQGSPLIGEQTLDFISNSGWEAIYADREKDWRKNYSKAPRTRKQLKELIKLAVSVLKKVEDLSLREEWTEGLKNFSRVALKSKYSDENIWSASSNLLKQIYTPQILNSDTGVNSSKVEDNIRRLITSSLATLGTIFAGNGLSVAVHINSSQENKSWSIVASAIDKLERLFQEVADVTFQSITTLPSFTPAQAIPGSWTILLQMSLNSNQSNLLARAISSLSSADNGENESNLSITDIENEEDASNLSIVDSWRDCVARLKGDNLRVDLAVSTDMSELNIIRSISTEDFPNEEESIQPNIRVLSHDVPQANILERVIDFASLLIQYPSSPLTVRQKFLEVHEITYRSFSYYRRSAEILGLADEREQPTTACYMLNRSLTQEKKIRFLAYQFISSKVGSAWFKWQNANDLLEIQPDTATDFLLAVCPSLSEITVQRRAQTLKSWVRIFQQNY